MNENVRINQQKYNKKLQSFKLTACEGEKAFLNIAV